MAAPMQAAIIYVNVICAVVAVAAVVAIPIVLHVNADRDRDNQTAIARNSRTLDVMNDLDAKASTIVAEKIRLDTENQVTGATRFSAAYIDHPDNLDVQTQVHRLLDLYDYLCLGGKRNLFSLRTIEEMKGDALGKTWSDYGGYMREHRKKNPAVADAWQNCDGVAAMTVP